MSDNSLMAVAGRIYESPFWLDDSALVHDIEGRFYDEYIMLHPDFRLMVRQAVLDRLVVAQSLLPIHIKLVIRAGFRPLEVQAAMFNSYMQTIRELHSDWNEEVVRSHAERYVSNPEMAAPPHTTGGAVDVELYDQLKGVNLDMGSNICELSEYSHSLNNLVSKKQYDNQKLLYDAMISAGFAPFATEWWHFSYGDGQWANYSQNKKALYDKIEL